MRKDSERSRSIDNHSQSHSPRLHSKLSFCSEFHGDEESERERGRERERENEAGEWLRHAEKLKATAGNRPGREEMARGRTRELFKEPATLAGSIIISHRQLSEIERDLLAVYGEECLIWTHRSVRAPPHWRREASAPPEIR